MYVIRYDIFFFFQAEDGIRDKLVTGVQTCALPISHPASRIPPPAQLPGFREGGFVVQDPAHALVCRYAAFPPGAMRSEERRVGKSVDLGGRRIIKKKKEKRRSVIVIE